MTADTANATDWSPLRDALGQLAAVCDGAEERDYRGFSAADVLDGHYLAELPVDEWTDLEARVAHHLARIYRKQLGSFGIEFEQLPAPPRAAQRPAAVGGERAQVTTARRTAARRERQIAAAHCGAMILHGGVPILFLALSSDLGLDAQVRALPGYVGADRYGYHRYTASAEVAAALIAFCEQHGIRVDNDVRDIDRFVAQHRTRVAERKAAREAAFGPNLLRDEHGALLLKFDGFPGARAVSMVKNLIPGRRWDEAARAWRLPDSSLPQAVAVATALSLCITADVLEQARTEQERRQVNRAASIALAPAGPVPETPGLAGELKPHQAAALEFIAANRRVLIGDKMGLGKTLTALAAVAQAATWPAVVVCKASLRGNWRSEIERFFPDLAVFVATGTVPGEIPAGTDIVVIGFDVLREHVTVTRAGTKTQVPGWLTALTALAPRALIVDESQFGKESAALRSRAMEALAQTVPPDGLVLCLTGTAIVNRPRELVQQLKILGRLDQFGDEKAFLYRYCDPDIGEFGTTFNGASNLDELHALLRETGVYLRRGDEALNLPPLSIDPLRMEKGALEPKAMEAYRRAEQDFLAEWVTLALRRGVDLADPQALYEFCARAMNAQALVRLNLLRQLVGEAKRPATIALVSALVKQREKVMIAAHHRESVATYAKKFGRLRIQGGQSTESIEADKLAFQSLPISKAPVITVSTQAGGVGHTLTAAARGVMAELPWTWAEVEQMAARLHRIGQQRPVDFCVVLAPGTVDDQMWQTIIHKRQVTHAVLDAPDAHPADAALTATAGEDERNAAATVMSLMLAEHAKTNMPRPRRSRSKR